MLEVALRSFSGPRTIPSVVKVVLIAGYSCSHSAASQNAMTYEATGRNIDLSKMEAARLSLCKRFNALRRSRGAVLHYFFTAYALVLHKIAVAGDAAGACIADEASVGTDTFALPCQRMTSLSFNSPSNRCVVIMSQGRAGFFGFSVPSQDWEPPFPGLPSITNSKIALPIHPTLTKPSQNYLGHLKMSKSFET